VRGGGGDEGQGMRARGQGKAGGGEVLWVEGGGGLQWGWEHALLTQHREDTADWAAQPRRPLGRQQVWCYHGQRCQGRMAFHPHGA